MWLELLHVCVQKYTLAYIFVSSTSYLSLFLSVSFVLLACSYRKNLCKKKHKSSTKQHLNFMTFFKWSSYFVLLPSKIVCTDSTRNEVPEKKAVFTQVQCVCVCWFFLLLSLSGFSCQNVSVSAADFYSMPPFTFMFHTTTNAQKKTNAHCDSFVRRLDRENTACASEKERKRETIAFLFPFIAQKPDEC